MVPRLALACSFGAAIAAGCSGSASNSPPAEAGVQDVAAETGVQDATAEASLNASDDSGGQVADVSMRADSSVAVTCSPMSTGVPVWNPSAGYPRSACTTADVATIVHDCLLNNLPACAQDHTTLAGCYQCLVTPADSAAWGPFVTFPYVTFFNLGGCFGIEMGDMSSTGCGAVRSRLDDCLWSTCGANCYSLDASAVDGGSYTLYQACIAEAKAGLCATYESAINNTCPANSSVYPLCKGSGLTNEEFQDQLGDIFCAPGTDGGGANESGD